MAEYKNKPFIDFSVNGESMSEYGIIRVSDGEGFQQSFSRSFDNHFVEMPASYKKLLMGSNNTETNMTVNFCTVTQGLTEKQLREIKQLFQPYKQIELSFAEFPIKKYKVVLAEPPEFNFNVFGGGETNRVYRGTGGLVFTMVVPFGIIENTVELPSEEGYEEWIEAVGRWEYKEVNENWEWAEKIEDLDELVVNEIRVANFGDVETDFILNFTAAASGDVTISDGTNNISFFVTADATYVLDTEKWLVKEDGLPIAYTGDMFKIPPNGIQRDLTLSVSATLVKIEYDYLYY